MLRAGQRLRLFLASSLVVWSLLHLRVWSDSFAAGKKVLVTGAGGQTGRIVVEKLVSTGRYDVRALVHSEKSKHALLKQVEMLPDSKVIVGDITSKESIVAAFAGVLAVVVVTSAVPKLKVWSLIPFMLAKLFGKKGKLKFSWKGGKPEQVDWQGQKNQFDCAKEAGAQQVVVVGTMTGTEKDSFLNSIGDGDGDKIVMWKRKAEVYLIDLCKDSKMKYTIIHAGGLSDTAGGVAPVAVGVDDKLREVKPARRIPRADVAEVCVQALECKATGNRSFDLTSIDGGQTLSRGGLEALLETLNGANCDYTINPPP